jgi:GGDEF domain-containing protein
VSSIRLKEIFPTIEINTETNKAILNEKAQELFSNNLDDVLETIKQLDFNKKIVFAYIGRKFFAINVIRGIKFIYLLFTEATDASYVFNSIQTPNSKVAVDVYSRDILREFLEKFLALKRRYGGFHIKFLYLKIDFVVNVKKKIQREFIANILKYTIAITRSSDVVGQIDESSFGIILTNASSEGANIVADKITRYISDINVDHDKRVLDLYASLGHELFVLKYADFDELIKKLDMEAEFITVGSKLKEVVRG